MFKFSKALRRRWLYGGGFVLLAALALGCGGKIGPSSSNGSTNSATSAAPAATQTVESVGEFFATFHVREDDQCADGSPHATLTIWTRNQLGSGLEVKQGQTVLFEGSLAARENPNIWDITYHPDDRGSYWTHTFNLPKSGSVHVTAVDQGYGPPLTWLGFGNVFDNDLTNVCKAAPPPAPKSVKDGVWVSSRELSTRVAASLERVCDPKTGAVTEFIPKARAVGKDAAFVRVRVNQNADSIPSTKLDPAAKDPWSTSITPTGAQTWIVIIDATNGDNRVLINQTLSNRCDK